MEELFHSHHSNHGLKTAIVAIMVCSVLRTRDQFVMNNNIHSEVWQGKVVKGRFCLLFPHELLKPKHHLWSTWICNVFLSSRFIHSSQWRRLYSSWRCTHHSVGVSSPLQVIAALSVSVGADTQTIGGVELLHQERAAGLNHRRQL